MTHEHKDRDENTNKEISYHCEVCKKKYSEEDARAVKGICCKTDLTLLQDLYRSDPSPTGP
jgi:actin-related protein